MRGLIPQEPSLAIVVRSMVLLRYNYTDTSQVENGNEVNKIQKMKNLRLLCFKQSAGAYLFILCYMRQICARACVSVIVVANRSVTIPSATEMPRLDSLPVQDWHLYSFSECSDGELAS